MPTPHKKKGEKMSAPDFILKCYKCSHNVYIEKDRVHEILKTDCPECGEESFENWILIGEGNYDKEFKK
jgi:predicted RNA-binding Zn-ribbon protein involved in translation (DUF1610 family)